ncbi:hypothetical protein JCM10295v2_004595 [Rhodotorula toruloides]
MLTFSNAPQDAAEAISSTQPHLLQPPHLGSEVYELALRPYETAFWQATRRRAAATLRALGTLVGRDIYGTLPTIVAQYFLDQHPALTASAIVQSLHADDQRKLVAAISAFLREQLVEAPFSITRARRVKPRAAQPPPAPPPTATGAAELRRGKRSATRVFYGEQQVEDDEDGKSKKRKTPRGAAAAKDKDAPPEPTPSLDSVAGKALDDVLGKLNLQLAQRDAIRSDVLTALVTLLEIRDHGMIAPSKVTSTMASGCDGKTVKSILQQRSMAKASSGVFLKLRQMTGLPLVPNFRPEFVDFNMYTITFLGDHLDRLVDGAKRMCMRTVAAVVPHLDATELLKEPNAKIRILDPVFKLFEVKPGTAGAPARSASPTHAFLNEYKRSSRLPQLAMKTEIQHIKTLFRAFRSAFGLKGDASMSAFVHDEHVAAEVANFFIRHELLPDNFECTGHMRASPSHLVVVGVRIDRIKEKCSAASFANGLDGLDITRLDAGQLFAVALVSHNFTTLELSAPRRADALEWYWDRDRSSLQSRRSRSLLDHISAKPTLLEVLEAVEAARPPPSARQQQTTQETIRGLPRDFLDLKQPSGRASLASTVANVKPSKLYQVGLTFGSQVAISGLVVAPAPPSFNQPFMEASFRYGRGTSLYLQRLANRRATRLSFRLAAELSSPMPNGPSNPNGVTFALRHEATAAAVATLRSASAYESGLRMDAKLRQASEAKAVARQLATLTTGGEDRQSREELAKSGVVVYVGSQVDKAKPRGPDTSKVIVRNLVVEYARLGVQYAFAKTPEAYTADRCPGCRDSPRPNAVPPVYIDTRDAEPALRQCVGCKLIFEVGAGTGANLVANGRAVMAEGRAIWRKE